MTRLKVAAGDSPDDVYAAVVDWAAEEGLELYPHQDEAVIELLGGANVVLATPTGSGKSLVAVAAHAEIAVVVVERVAPGKCGAAAGARRVLPLGLAGHVIGVVAAALPVQPSDEFLRIVPAHAHGRTRAAAEVAEVGIARAIRILAQGQFDLGVLTRPGANGPVSQSSMQRRCSYPGFDGASYATRVSLARADCRFSRKGALSPSTQLDHPLRS